MTLLRDIWIFRMLLCDTIHNLWRVLLGRVLLGREPLLGRVLLGRVLLGRVLLGRVLLGRVLLSILGSRELLHHAALLVLHNYYSCV
jgi:hypothetical protein